MIILIRINCIYHTKKKSFLISFSLAFKFYIIQNTLIQILLYIILNSLFYLSFFFKSQYKTIFVLPKNNYSFNFCLYAFSHHSARAIYIFLLSSDNSFLRVVGQLPYKYYEIFAIKICAQKNNNNYTFNNRHNKTNRYMIIFLK